MRERDSALDSYPGYGKDMAAPPSMQGNGRPNGRLKALHFSAVVENQKARAFLQWKRHTPAGEVNERAGKREESGGNCGGN